MHQFKIMFIFACVTSLVACSSMQNSENGSYAFFNTNFTERLAPQMQTNGEKIVLVNPNIHTWGAYNERGELVKAGIATAGGATCPPDADEADCRTGIGSFRITSLGDGMCASKIYPRPTGGGLMPYCMFFNNGQALHGAPDPLLVEDNVSHGCVRMRISDAEWMRYNFASIGTKVIVLPYVR